MSLIENNPKHKVIIIGAGISGIAAATRLYKKGIKDVLLLEAQDKIGGRICTMNFGTGNEVELGAQWVHGEKGNVVHDLASERSLLEYDDPNFGRSFFVNSSSGLVDENLCEKIYNVINNVRNEDPKAQKMKYGDFLTSCFIEELKSEKVEIEDELKQSLIFWCEQTINSIDGSDSWYDTSITTSLHYEECEGCSTIAWKSGGYQNLINILMEGIEDEINKKVLLNHEVVRINWNKEPITIECTNGITMEADTLIVTVSLGVLKENYKTLFNPALPNSKINAIKGLGYGTVDKLFIEFPEKWWTNEIHGFSLLWNQKDREQMRHEGRGWLCDVFGFYEVSGTENVLLGWISGPSARKMESKTDDEVKNELMWLLRKFVGKLYDIPDPNFFLRSRWYSNKYIRGSYSYRSVLTDELETSAEILAEPLVFEKGNSKLLFAGEATHYRYHSTVHGALESGWREADRIIKNV